MKQWGQENQKGVVKKSKGTGGPVEQQRGAIEVQGKKMERCGDRGKRESDKCDSRDGVVIEQQVPALGDN